MPRTLSVPTSGVAQVGEAVNVSSVAVQEYAGVIPAATSAVDGSVTSSKDSNTGVPTTTRPPAALVANVPVGATSAITARVVVVAVSPLSSVTVRVTVYSPLSEYVCVVTAPLALAPSPKFHAWVRGLPFGSDDALPSKSIALPSPPAYGPPAAATGGSFGLVCVIARYALIRPKPNSLSRPRGPRSSDVVSRRASTSFAFVMP